jgi:phage terminase large subunit GpA-like protein
LDALGWRAATRPRPSLYVGPTELFCRQTIDERLTRMLDTAKGLEVDHLRSTKLLRYFNGVRLRLGWGGSPASLASDQAGDIVVDEYDKMFGSQRRGGDPFELALARSDTYNDRKMMVTSTPIQGRVETKKDPVSGLEFWDVADTESVESPIWRRWQSGTMHHAVWQCPHCQSWFVPRLSLLTSVKDATPGEMRTNTWVTCPASGCKIGEEHKDTMNEHWGLVAPGQTISSDGAVHGEPCATHILSVWVSGLMSPFVPWGKRAADLAAAKLTGESESIQAVTNNGGECWSPVTVKALAPEHVRTKIAEYRFGQVPGEVLRITMGADVQGNRIVYVVRGWGARGRSWLLERNEVFGRTSEDEVWSRFALVFQHQYAGMRIEKAVIDAGFRPDKPEAGEYHKVLDFCHSYEWIAQASRGKAKQASPVISGMEDITAEGKKDKYGLQVLKVDTDYFKTQWFWRLSAPKGHPNSAHFPEDIDDEYCRQIVSEVRVGNGEWQQLSRQNHYLDAESLAGVAAHILKLTEIPDGAYRSLELGEIVLPGTAPIGLVAAKSIRERMAERSARMNGQR